MWSQLELSEAAWSYLDLCGAIWSYLELSGAIWSYLELSAAMWSYLKLSEAMRSYLELSGAVRLPVLWVSPGSRTSQASSFNQALLLDPGNDVLFSILNKSLVWGLALGSYRISCCKNDGKR